MAKAKAANLQMQVVQSTDGIMTKQQLKQQRKMEKKLQKKDERALGKRMKNHVSDAMILFRLKRKVHSPVTLNKVLLWLLIFIVLFVSIMLLGILFMVDQYHLPEILHNMFVSLGWPDFLQMMFNV